MARRPAYPYPGLRFSVSMPTSDGLVSDLSEMVPFVGYVEPAVSIMAGGGGLSKLASLSSGVAAFFGYPDNRVEILKR